MGSIAEEELLQMVRDFIESDSTSPFSLPSSKSLAHNDHPPYHTLNEILGRAMEAEVEVLEKILMYMRDISGDHTNHMKKWLVTKLKMDGYEASLCKTSWLSAFGYSKVVQCTGDYEYIDVMVRDSHGDDEEPTRLIVDVDFKSQFEVARPTATYKELINTLPSVFVGSEEKLNQIISLLCSAAKKSLKERGLHVPPWRKANYMRSKWLSKECKKVSLSTNMDLAMVSKE
ncbi:uncharacterized protein LOC111989510 [Quercus suber]|uniref:uncharacterized protein LOC111989510 n=1 Tax=Quercus suber TaxID=58331 RepID=UPI000CE1CEE9|nr:uncharacterized protein LOC111989510 [Quercus suber]POE80304.1 hypothetical protein CFP56_14070 [Quercus suber]